MKSSKQLMKIGLSSVLVVLIIGLILSPIGAATDRVYFTGDTLAISISDLIDNESLTINAEEYESYKVQITQEKADSTSVTLLEDEGVLTSETSFEILTSKLVDDISIDTEFEISYKLELTQKEEPIDKTVIDETTIDLNESPEDLEDVTVDETINADPIVIEPVILEGTLQYKYIVSRTASVHFKEGQNLDLVDGKTIAVEFPKGINESTVEFSLLDSKDTEVYKWTFENKVNKEAELTIPDNLLSEDTEYHLLVSDTTFTEEDLNWKYDVNLDTLHYFAPLSEEDYTVTFTSTNEDPTVAKQGDRVMLSVKGLKEDESAQWESESLKEGDTLPARELKDNLQDQTNITYTLTIEDSHGNKPISLTGGSIVYYAPITSNPSLNADKAKIGAEIELSLNSNHTVSTSGTFMETQIETSETAVKAVVPNVPDQTRLAYSLTLMDKAGNVLDVTGEGPIAFAPLEVQSIRIEGKEALKDGDELTVDIKANHAFVAQGELAEVSVGQYTFASSFTERVEVNSLEDQQNVGYRLVLTDEVGQTVSLEKYDHTYYAPIEAVIIPSHEYSKTKGYASGTNEIKAVVEANHKVEITSSSFGISSIEERTHTLVGTAKGFTDGPLTLSVVLRDKARNETALTRDMEVVIDNTAPTLSISPDLGTFINEDIKLVMRAEDKNLDLTSLSINGKTQTDRASTESVTKTFEIVDENEYTFLAEAEDKAGNKTSSSTGKVIVDKTNPEITTYDIDLTKEPVYKAGIRLSSMFGVGDKHLKNIDAVIERANGTVAAVDLNDVLDTEGRQTASLTATDMAGNNAKRVSYTFWIDGTAPKLILTSSKGKVPLSDTDKNDISEGETLKLELDKIWMGSEKPDRIEKVQSLNERGQREDLFRSIRPTSEFTFEVPRDAREIIISAVDDVGNGTGEVSYQMSMLPKNVETLLSSNDSLDETKRSGMWIVVSSATATILAASAWVILKKKQENDA